MKKILIILLVGIVIGVLAMILLNRFYPLGNIFRSTEDANQDIIETNSFYKVTGKLDKGGDYYAYFNTERINKLISDSLSGIQDAVVKSDNLDSGIKKNSEKPIQLVRMIIEKTGLYNIDGAGFSVIEKKNDIYRSRLVIHHPSEKSGGLIWKIFGEKSYKLEALNLLPSNTVFAGFSSLNFGTLKSWIFDLAKSSGIKDFEDGTKTIETSLSKSGIDLNKLLSSIEGFSGIIITFNKKNMKIIPQGDKKMEIPDPGLAIVLTVKNDYIFNLIKKMVPGVETTENNGKKVLKLKGSPPLPITFNPQIVQRKNYLIISSNSKISEGIFNAIDGKNRITKSEEFVNISYGMPASGNSFTFMSKDLLIAIKNISGNFNQNKNLASDFMKKIGISLDNISFFRVMENSNEGVIITSNSTLKPEAAVLIPAVMSVGIISAVVIPQIIKSKKFDRQPFPPPPPSSLNEN